MAFDVNEFQPVQGLDHRGHTDPDPCGKIFVFDFLARLDFIVEQDLSDRHIYFKGQKRPLGPIDPQCSLNGKYILFISNGYTAGILMRTG